MDPEDVSHLIENRLYHLRPSGDITPCVVKVQVKNIGSWVVKIRTSSVIVNDRLEKTSQICKLSITIFDAAI
jgi:hypothetical protein